MNPLGRPLDLMLLEKDSEPLPPDHVKDDCFNPDLDSPITKRMRFEAAEEALQNLCARPRAAPCRPPEKLPVAAGPSAACANEGPEPTESEQDPLPFMKPLEGQVWKRLPLDAEYVPAIGSFPGFVPVAKTAKCAGTVLAMNPGCGRGKSSSFRAHMHKVLKHSPNARILLMSANILYGTNLAHELEQDGFDVGFYKDAGADLASCQVVVCSLESLHHVDGQHFDLMLIDEVRTIANIVGGETLKDFANLFLLRVLCSTTPQIVVCDADLLYTANGSEPVSAVHDFLAFVAEGRSVVCASLTKPPPPHLVRSARLFHDCKKDVARGKEEWMAELEDAMAAWHLDHEHRFAVCVGSKAQMREVCARLEQQRVPWKPYSGETGEKDRLEDLKDPDATWIEFGAIVSTTTLSIGVDPKRVQFARVFMWTCRVGCSALAQFQAAQRFGRSAAAPLLNATIDILVDGVPPDMRKEPPAARSFDDELQRLQVRRGARTRMYARMMDAGGGAVVSLRQPSRVSDQMLRLMAHGALERACQRSDMHATVVRICEHHGWRLVEETPHDACAKVEASGAPPLDTAEDDLFGATYEPEDKFEVVLRHIAQHGEEAFFDNCFGLEVEDAPPEHRSSVEQYLVKAYWLMRPLGRLVGAADLALMEKPGVFAGLTLNAVRRCRSPEEQMKRDRLAQIDAPKKKRKHPFKVVNLGTKLAAADECAELLQVDSLLSDCELPLELVELANREAAGEASAADRSFVQRLRWSADALGAASRPGLVGVLGDLATACGMTLERDRARKQRNGCRTRSLEGLRLVRVLPSIVDDWLVKSDRLDRLVRVADWASEHAQLDDEEQQLTLALDDELDDELFASNEPSLERSTDAIGAASPLIARDTRDERTEKVDGASLAVELARLRELEQRLADKGGLAPRDQRWLDFLRTVDAVALPKPRRDGPPPPVRWYRVVYGKRRAIGRRTASHPSSQHCPSTLRPLLFKHFYHDVDIVSCHPTLLLQVARKMGVAERELAPLAEYVRDSRLHPKERLPMLVRIGEFYDVPPAKCKYAVLRVLNGGSLMAWIRDAGCTRRNMEEQDDLRQLQRVSQLVRGALFRMPKFQGRIATLTDQVQAAAATKAAQAEALHAAAKTLCQRRAAVETLRRARHKATPIAVERSVFSLCLFELEDMVLGVIDEHFRAAGWTVASLQFDGLQPEHRDGADLEATMRGAEAAVLAKLGYEVALTEKELFEVSDAVAAMRDDDECLHDDE